MRRKGIRSLAALALLAVLLLSLVPTALAAPDAQSKQSDSGKITVRFHYQEVTLFASGDENSRNTEDEITRVTDNTTSGNFVLGKGLQNVESLQGFLEILANGGVVPVQDWQYQDFITWMDGKKWVSTEYAIDMDFPITNEIASNKISGPPDNVGECADAINEISKKVVFTKTKEEAGISALDSDGEGVITIYNGSDEGITFLSRSSVNQNTAAEKLNEHKIIFSKGLEVIDGAVVNFKTERFGGSGILATHFLTVSIGSEESTDAKLEVNGGTLNVSGLKCSSNYGGREEGTFPTFSKPSSTYLTFNNASMTVSNGGAVALDGVQVEGTAPEGNNLVTVGENCTLTVEDGKTYGNGAPSNITVTSETPAVKCEAGSSLTLSGSSTVTSKGDKAVDLEKGAKVTIGDGEEHTIGEVADAFVDNSGFLVEKQNEGDLIPKVDATEVENPKFGNSIESGAQETLTTAVGGITAELPTEEQASVANSYAQDPNGVKADFGDIDVEDKEIYVHVLTTVETTVEEYDADSGILTLDITPYYTVVASTSASKEGIHLSTEGADQQNAVTLRKKTELHVTTPVSMTIPLPGGFSGISSAMIIHEHDGKTDRYTGNVSGGKVTFTTDGFSTFKLVALKNGTLKDLTSSAGSMEPFDPGKTDKTYTVSVPYSVTELTLTATKVNSYGTVTAAREDGEAPTVADAGSNNFTVSVPDLEVGENTVIITVTHESTETTHTVTIVRAAYVPPVPPSYMVTVEADENATVETSATGVRAGDSVTVTVTPAENFHVSGVTVTGADGKEITVVDNGDGTYTFTMPSGGVTVKAETFKCPSVEYTDIDVTEWYHDYVDYAITHDLMEGVGDGVFAPEKTVTRAQMAGILWNLEGQPVVNYLMTFTDVPDGKWYTEAIRWAASEGIISGFGDDTFRPEDIITREQMAAMLYFYEEYKNGDHTVDAELTFTDSGEVSSWANEAVVWCVGKDLIHGKGDNAFDPRGTSIRAQLATLLALYDQMDK